MVSIVEFLILLILGLAVYFFGLMFSPMLSSNGTIIICNPIMELNYISECAKIGTVPGVVLYAALGMNMILFFLDMEVCLITSSILVFISLLFWYTWRIVGYIAETNGIAIHHHNINGSKAHYSEEKPCYYDNFLGKYSYDCILAGFEFYMIIFYIIWFLVMLILLCIAIRHCYIRCSKEVREEWQRIEV